MSASFNQIVIMGNLGKDPELRYTPQGTPICSFTMCVNERKKVDGEWQESPLWFKIKVWGRQAEPVSQFLSKGRPCLVSGRLTVEEWTNRDNKAVTTLVVEANEVKFLGDGGSGGRSSETASSERPRASTPPAAAPAPQAEISDDDIPF